MRKTTVSFPRTLTLLLGTGLIVGLCYAVAAPPPVDSPSAIIPPDPIRITNFAAAARTVAEQFRTRSGQSWPAIAKFPFVITGDVPEEQLSRLHAEVIAPTVRALQIDYFDLDPAEPILIVILSSDDVYRQTLDKLGHGKQAEYSGLYHREMRMVVINLSTGPGTVAHELTHALAHADFPDLPEWFDEGLASLHEESEFSPDGLHLVGRENWRRKFLDEALARDCWKPLDRLLDEPFADPDIAALDYALSRYVCLYLQERGLLAPFYRKCRSGIATDPTGRFALERILGGKPLDEIDRDFRDWLATRVANDGVERR